MRRYQLGLGGIALAAALYVLIFGAVRYNLEAASAQLAREPATIVIDAGHGGEDGGAAGVAGTSESQLNLSVALRLEQFLTFCGFRTHMIRTTDESVYTGDCETITEKKISDLKHRVEIVNSIHPAILVSIHQNHFSEEKYAGAQVFYAKTQTSRELAEQMQELLRITLNPSNQRTCKQASAIYLMEKINCPGVLVECGFLSNREEEQLLQRPEYQKKITCAIAGALIQYTRGDSDLEV